MANRLNILKNKFIKWQRISINTRSTLADEYLTVRPFLLIEINVHQIICLFLGNLDRTFLIDNNDNLLCEWNGLDNSSISIPSHIINDPLRYRSRQVTIFGIQTKIYCLKLFNTHLQIKMLSRTNEGASHGESGWLGGKLMFLQ